jgi:hypothetical protein
MCLQARAATEASVSTLQQYYSQLTNLQGLLPINADHVRIPFTWQDAFK